MAVAVAVATSPSERHQRPARTERRQTSGCGALRKPALDGSVTTPPLALPEMQDEVDWVLDSGAAG